MVSGKIKVLFCILFSTSFLFGQSGLVSDGFNDTVLDTDTWTITNPLSDATISMTGTELSIEVPDSSIHEVWGSTDDPDNFVYEVPRVMQPVNDTDFYIEVKFNSAISTTYQEQGILIEEDSGTLIRFEFFSESDLIYLFAAWFEDSLLIDYDAVLILVGGTAPTYMRISREGDTWTQSWSTNGIDYTDDNTFDFILTASEVGLYAGNSAVSVPEDAPAHTALFDYFIGSDTPLPVELSAFTANAVAGVVRLEWETRSEIQNVGFEILRSEKKSGEYQLIASYKTEDRLAGQINSSIGHFYSYEDDLVGAGETFWYKLVSVDIAGVREHFGPVGVDVSAYNQQDLIIAGIIPADFELNQNYPNPFNISTRIPFGVPRNNDELANIELTIYNVNGQRIVSLLEGKFEPGSYQAEWNGRHSDGHIVPSGTYLAVLKNSTIIHSIKMILVK